MRNGRESTCAAARGHQPLESLPPLRRGRGRSRLEDVEVGRERGVDARARDRERRTVGALSHREEAGEQDAAGLEDVPDDTCVLRPPGGIDRAEARVFPHRVERRAEVHAQVEDVALLERDAHAFALRETPRFADGSFREVEPRDGIAATGEEPRIVPAAGPRHGEAGARGHRDAGVEASGQRRGGLAQLPAVLARGVEAVPEARRAYGRAIAGHSRFSKFAMARSAPACRSSSAVCAVVMPMARMPARRAASRPTKESSKTTHVSGRTRSRAAASWYTSGSGLPYVTSSAVTITSK